MIPAGWDSLEARAFANLDQARRDLDEIEAAIAERRLPFVTTEAAR